MIEIKEYKFGINCGLRFLDLATVFYKTNTIQKTMVYILSLFPREELNEAGEKIVVQNEDVDLVKEVYNLIHLAHKAYTEKTKTESVFDRDLYYELCDEVGLNTAIELLLTQFMTEFTKSISYGVKSDKKKVAEATV